MSHRCADDHDDYAHEYSEPETILNIITTYDKLCWENARSAISSIISYIIHRARSSIEYQRLVFNTHERA